MRNSIKILLGLSLAIIGTQAQAVPCIDTTSGVFTLGTTTATGENDATNSVSIANTAMTVGCEDHTGNDPWGAGELVFDGMTFDALSKFDWGENKDTGITYNTLTEAVDIDLTVTAGGVPGVVGETDTAAPYGTWSFTNVAAYDSYIIVLKDGVLVDGIKWSAYLLDSSLFDPTGSTWAGDWIFGGEPLKDISHLSVYGKYTGSVPEPGMVGLLAIGLLGVIVARRRMKV